jgi:hypothetical protein
VNVIYYIYVKRFRKILKSLVHNPYVDLTLGTVLAISGISEAWGSIGQDITNFRLGVHHGAIVFGAVTAFRALVDIFAGLEFMDEAEYEEKIR